MIFNPKIYKEDIRKLIATGKKNQTRRLIKWGKEKPTWGLVKRKWVIVKVEDMRGRAKYEVGKSYSVQLGRGQKCAKWKGKKLKIKIKSIKQETIGEISDYDVWQEGFENDTEFFEAIQKANTKKLKLTEDVWAIGFEKAVKT